MAAKGLKETLKAARRDASRQVLAQIAAMVEARPDLSYKQIAEQVFLATDARKRMAEIDMKAPAASYAKFKVMGKEFDPALPEKYLGSFAIKKSA